MFNSLFTSNSFLEPRYTPSPQPPVIPTTPVAPRMTRSEQDVLGKWVNSYQEAQSFAVPNGSQTIFINMNEAEIYSKTRDANGIENILTFTIIPKEKPKEVEKKEKQENLIENLAAQNGAILQELKNIQNLLNAKNTTVTESSAVDIPIYGGK